ncbi:tetraacyldisaccharide 4'-kinase [Phorcysia thermohydrogeniphila]|uniref:Tetraacyldisaccharide 4'-kinase n=1 Tax=Phorcysia thermohydrogeniphila TaxID=936138 RepID=A0A4R1GEC5_9BACT|nr:tetraacyldisaccharide 4'-kinase [Phorcysia thermohydrogeniphila]TCK06554.1 lipid-A-disaccharide kinase [Phorcysia thermohydrogeniphila]
MNADELRKKVVRKEGKWKLLFPFLWGLSKLYCGAMAFRNFLYDAGFLKSFSSGLPIISVGNIVAGGAGKTPLTESIYLLLEEVGFSPAIVSRGYRGKEKGPAFAKPDPKRFGDEASLYALKKYRTVVSKEKVEGIKFAFKNGANVVILDDGFQHRKVTPKINIVAIDPFNPFGDGYCLPLGLLREPLKGLSRADCFVITRSNLVDTKRLESLELYLRTFKKPIFHAEQSFKFWVNQNFDRVEPPKGEIDVFCGIGNPGQFVEMLIRMGYTIRNLFIFQDHHEYTEEEIEKLKRLENPVTTEKDLIKLKGKGIKARAPVLRLEAYGLKEFILSNLEGTEKVKEEEIEGEFTPAGVSTFKG